MNHGAALYIEKNGTPRRYTLANPYCTCFLAGQRTTNLNYVKDFHVVFLDKFLRYNLSPTALLSVPLQEPNHSKTQHYPNDSHAIQ